MTLTTSPSTRPSSSTTTTSFDLRPSRLPPPKEISTLAVFRVRSRDERLEGSSFPAWVDCGAATITHYRPHSPASG